MSAKLKISEADVQQAVVLMLEIDGWRSIRTDPVSDRSRGKGFGEVGMPDYLFIRYQPGFRAAPETRRSVVPTDADVLWIEFKAPGKRPTLQQMIWHEVERARGALVITFIDAADPVGEFREWYKTSGLMRHQILS